MGLSTDERSHVFFGQGVVWCGYPNVKKVR